MKIRANAKINLTLDITGKRDDGYHILDSVFQSVSLYDEINIEEANELSVDFFASDVNGKTSIAYKSAEAFFDYTSLKKGAKITVTSQIPTSSGLGGGSSDSAGVLVGLNEFFGTGLSKETLCEIGGKIGADIPFCIIGGTARVKGIGEIIEPITNIEPLDLIIIKNKSKLSTADMYNKLDNAPKTEPKTQKMVEAITNRNKNEILNNISNAFYSVNDISFEEKLLKDHGAIKVGLSGSGPSVFGIFSDFESSAIAFKSLCDLNYNVFCAKTTDMGIIIE